MQNSFPGRYNILLIFKEDTITLVFLNQGYLIQPETIASLRRIPGLRVVVIDIFIHPVAEQAQALISILKEQNGRILFTVNEWGIDCDGLIWEFLEKEKIVHLNWFVDDPFYEEIIQKKKFKPSLLRLDFVSDKDYLPKMKERGYNAFFLPLGTDPSYFAPEDTPRTRDVSFVGNSYLTQMDELLIGADNLIIPMSNFLAKLIKSYNMDNSTDVESAIVKYLKNNNVPGSLSLEKAVFISKHFIGYMYRKQIVVELVKCFSGFSVIGDNGWKQLLDEHRVEKVGYYDGLRGLYNSTKINIDINRMVIKNGFTQRPFDSLACKCFCITSFKPIVADFFETTGENREIVTFSNCDEMKDLIKYFLKHETERESIAERGYKKILQHHTYDHRINEIFQVVSKYLSQ